MTPLAWLIVAVALGLGLVAGALLHRGLGSSSHSAARRRERSRSVRDAPGLGDLLHRTFRQSGSGLAVVAGNGDVVAHNSRAAALRAVVDGRLDSRAAAACQRALDRKSVV